MLRSVIVGDGEAGQGPLGMYPQQSQGLAFGNPAAPGAMSPPRNSAGAYGGDPTGNGQSSADGWCVLPSAAWNLRLTAPRGRRRACLPAGSIRQLQEETWEGSGVQRGAWGGR